MKLADLHKYITMLLDINPKNADLELVIKLDEPSQGPVANSKVKGFSQGFDWNSGKILIIAEDSIISKKD
jgi:hypothetical protein